MTNGGDSTPTAVCVLGMSRTGTSLTARVLSLAGVYLGLEEQLLQKDLRQLAGEDPSVLERARETNPEGFWEHYRIMRLNERILRKYGGSWRDPPAWRPGWERSDELAPEREEARALLEESFAGHRLWGWKDPRNCLTLPFWQLLLPRIRYVVCLRNPIDVAASLERRDGMAFEQAIDLWRTYVAASLINTADRPRIFVPYEAYFADRRDLVARLAAFVDRAGALEGEDARRRLAEAVDDRLWRNRTSTEELVHDDRVPCETISLHLLTERDGADCSTALDLYAERLLDSSRP